MTLPVEPGEILAGKYRVDHLLGQGGMGVVVAATHLQLHQKVAIKLLLEEGTPEVMARFLREARASALLKSEHVARVLDVGELPSGRPYMVMEHLQGSDLAGVLQQKGRLEVSEAVDYLLQACEAIAEAHGAGIVHRDLKPGNLFLTEDADGAPLVKVLDFGISKDTSDDPHQPKLTGSQVVLGSPSYMAPEQMMASRNADARADIWSLGILFYEMLTGRTPFESSSYAELVILVNATDPPPISATRGDVPKAVEAAILRCLERDRDRRFATVAELCAMIAPFGTEGGRRSAERIARRTSPGGAPSLPSASLPELVSAGTRDRLSLALSRSTPASPRSRLPLVGGLVAGVLITGIAAAAILGWLTHSPGASASGEPAPSASGERRWPSALTVPSAASTTSATSTAVETTIAPAEPIPVAPPPVASPSAPKIAAPIASSPRVAPSAHPAETAAPRPTAAVVPADPPKKNQLDMPIK